MDQSEPQEKPITRRMEKFCEEYLVDLIATRAAQRAGYSARSAYQAGHLLMKDPRVLARINQLMRAREESTRIKGYKVLEELATVALSSIDHYAINNKGFVEVKPDAPDNAMGAVSRIRRRARVLHTTTRVEGEETVVAELVEYDTEIHLHEKNPAITNALKHLGLLTDVVEHRDLTLEDILREAAGKPAGGAPETTDARDRETK